MRKISNRALIIIFLGLLAVSAVWILIAANIEQDELTAEIYVDGRLMYTLDLSKVTEEYTIELPHNTVLVGEGEISMLSADCPDQLCVRQGVIRNGIQPIICLPNRVEIRIVKDSGIDAVTGGRS
ncbi:MAG TPA: NusG domain II-containing protein [Clostridiales bacterium]|jgi:hypothetical protein|nr:NusG domain II-containing protein [Clostridiales bacterium]